MSKLNLALYWAGSCGGCDISVLEIGEGVFEAAEHAWAQIGERYDQLRHDVERPLLPPAELWLSPDTLRETLKIGRASCRERV